LSFLQRPKIDWDPLNNAQDSKHPLHSQVVLDEVTHLQVELLEDGEIYAKMHQHTFAWPG
jgi:hypothetical protein